MDRLLRELALEWHASEEMHRAWETTGEEREEHLREMYAARAALGALSALTTSTSRSV